MNKVNKRAELATLLYEALKKYSGESALVMGHPNDESTTALDGEFNLRKIAQYIISKFDSSSADGRKDGPI